MMLEHWEERFRTGPLPPVVLLFGEERFLVEEAAQMLRRRLEAQDPLGVDVELLDGETIPARELVERARSYPVAAERRGVIVRRAEHLLGRSSGAGASVLADYLRAPQPTTVLVLLVEAVPERLRGISRFLRNPKQQKKAEQALARAPELWRLLLREHPWVEFPKLYEREVPSWIAQRARRYGIELSPPALEALLSLVGAELAELDSELQKLALYAQARGLAELDVEHVLHLTGHSRAYSVFELQRALTEGDRVRALQIAQYLTRSQRQELLIVATLTRFFLLLWRLADFQQEPPAPEELASALGVHPFFVAEYQAAYRRFGLPAIEGALFALQRAELALKSGSAPPESVIGELLLSIMGVVGHRNDEHAL